MNNSNLHDLFAVVESEGVDLMDSNAYEPFNEIRSDGASLLSRERGQNTTFYKAEPSERTASIRMSKDNLQKIFSEKQQLKLSQVDERGEIDCDETEQQQTEIGTKSTVQSQRMPDSKIKHESKEQSVYSKRTPKTGKNVSIQDQDDD